MSKIYEALKRLEKNLDSHDEKIPSEEEITSSSRRAFKLGFPFLFLSLAVFLGLGLVLFLNWRLTPSIVNVPVSKSETKAPQKIKLQAKREISPSQSSFAHEFPKKTKISHSQMLLKHKEQPKDLDLKGGGKLTKNKKELPNKEALKISSHAGRSSAPLPKEAKTILTPKGSEEANTQKTSLSKKKQPSEPGAKEKMASALCTQKSSSSSSLSKGTPRSEQTDIAILLLAEEARHKGDITQALFYYRAYLEKNFDPKVANNYGALLLAQGRPEEAVAILKKAYHATKDRDPALAFNLSLALVQTGARKEACAILAQEPKDASWLPRWQALRKNLRCPAPK